MATTTIVLLSDSTNGWFVETSTLPSFLPEKLYGRYGRTIKVSENGTFGGSYTAQTIQWYGGVGADEIHLYDGAVGGSNWDDVNDLPVRVTAVDPDIVLIAYGINGGAFGATGLDTLIVAVQAAVPAATVVLMSQNPITAHNEGDDQNRNIIQGYAASYGLLFIDVYQAFIDYGPTWDADLLGGGGVHPNDAGKDLYVATVDPALFDAGLLGAEQEASTVAVIDSAAAVYRANRYSGSGDWLDESGNGHHAVLSGSTTWEGDKFAMGGPFSVADADDLDPALGDFTFVVVAAPPDPLASQGLIQKRSAGVPWWDGNVASDGRFVMGAHDGTNTRLLTLNGVAVAGQRQVFSGRVIRSTDTIRAGVDGTYGNSGIAGFGTITSPTALGIGGGFSADFTGDIYGAAIFGTSLSDADVAQAGVELIASPSQNRMGGTGAIRKPPR